MEGKITCLSFHPGPFKENHLENIHENPNTFLGCTPSAVPFSSIYSQLLAWGKISKYSPPPRQKHSEQCSWAGGCMFITQLAKGTTLVFETRSDIQQHICV